jgi:hypothetical protein
MPKLKQNAMKILEWLYKNNVTLTSDMTVREIKVALKMPPEEFDEADTYLLREKLIEGTFGSDDGRRWFTSEGINIAEEAVSAPNFWQRKKDDIIMLVIGLVVGVVGTLVVQALAKLI